MNQKTTKFNQDAFVAHDALPGSISPALSHDIASHGVRTDALHTTSYTAGDTSGKPDSGLPEVAEANTPKRISRKYIPIQSNSGKGQDAVFPQNSDESEFTWRHTGFHNDNFMSVKDTKPVNAVVPKKDGPSSDVMGLLKQLGHSDAGNVASSTQNVTNQVSQEKAIVVNLSPTSLANSEFNNHISTMTNDSQIHNRNTSNIKSKPSSKIGANTGRNDHITNNTMPTVITQSDSEVYEQVRAILGEGRQDWKQVIKSAKSATNSVSPSTTAVNNSTVATHENRIEQMIQQVLNQETNNRVELEHVLTHKFSTELTNMQQSMNKKIQDLRETLNNFMMR
jgi:hypothetical protein